MMEKKNISMDSFDPISVLRLMCQAIELTAVMLLGDNAYVIISGLWLFKEITVPAHIILYRKKCIHEHNTAQYKYFNVLIHTIHVIASPIYSISQTRPTKKKRDKSIFLRIK